MTLDGEEPLVSYLIEDFGQVSERSRQVYKLIVYRQVRGRAPTAGETDEVRGR
jgi:hypothetical protein